MNLAATTAMRKGLVGTRNHLNLESSWAAAYRRCMSAARLLDIDSEQELKANNDKFSDMREHLRHRVGDMERYRELMREMGHMTHFVFGKLRASGTSDTDTIKKLRVAFANFKSEVEEIFRERKKD
jgi:hypothetical protein